MKTLIGAFRNLSKSAYKCTITVSSASCQVNITCILENIIKMTKIKNILGSVVFLCYYALKFHYLDKMRG